MKSWEDLAESAILELVEEDLPRVRAKTKRVLIVGAGMAGLAAAEALLRAGHDPLILEAQGRVGGRILTLREPFSEGLYAEAGAMRLPRSHRLTMAYVDRFELPTQAFTAASPEAYLHFNGRKLRRKLIDNDPDLLGFETAAPEKGRSVFGLWDEAIAPYGERLEREGTEAWEAIVADCDHYSVREFLEDRGWSEGAIECFGLLANYEALMNSSFLELLREELGRYYQDLVHLPGGMDQLPRAFLPALSSRIRFGANLVAIDQDPESVTLHYKTGAGHQSVSGDYAILTLPFSVLRHIEVMKPFSARKQRAIRQLRYDASAKIFLQCGRRFWEQDDGIYGGGTVTDLAIRNLYYPDHGRETGRGVLLASYTWSEDAQRWGSLPEHQRLEQAIENVAQIHPQISECVEVGASKMWHDDPYAGGAFALFDPGQQTLLHRAIIAPEGRIHFAGEHTSLMHAWIQGALESGLRAAYEIHNAAH